jgi:hypothetical protein
MRRSCHFDGQQREVVAAASFILLTGFFSCCMLGRMEEDCAIALSVRKWYGIAGFGLCRHGSGGLGQQAKDVACASPDVERHPLRLSSANGELEGWCLRSQPSKILLLQESRIQMTGE